MDHNQIYVCCYHRPGDHLVLIVYILKIDQSGTLIVILMNDILARITDRSDLRQLQKDNWGLATFNEL